MRASPPQHRLSLCFSAALLPLACHPYLSAATTKLPALPGRAPQTLHLSRALRHNLNRATFEGSTHYAREGQRLTPNGDTFAASMYKVRVLLPLPLAELCVAFLWHTRCWGDAVRCAELN